MCVNIIAKFAASSAIVGALSLGAVAPAWASTERVSNTDVPSTEFAAPPAAGPVAPAAAVDHGAQAKDSTQQVSTADFATLNSI